VRYSGWLFQLLFLHCWLPLMLITGAFLPTLTVCVRPLLAAVYCGTALLTQPPRLNPNSLDAFCSMRQQVGLCCCCTGGEHVYRNQYLCGPPELQSAGAGIVVQLCVFARQTLSACWSLQFGEVQEGGGRLLLFVSGYFLSAQIWQLQINSQFCPVCSLAAARALTRPTYFVHRPNSTIYTVIHATTFDVDQ
jgi:hypothetical protein